MRKLFLTVLVILSACAKEEIPEDLLGRNQMVEIMIEIHVLESTIASLPVRPRDSAKAVYQHYEKLLFEEQGITKDQYERSFNYYVDHPNDFEKIYNTVVDSLSARDERYQ